VKVEGCFGVYVSIAVPRRVLHLPQTGRRASEYVPILLRAPQFGHDTMPSTAMKSFSIFHRIQRFSTSSFLSFYFIDAVRTARVVKFALHCCGILDDMATA